jgi:hypothetical protein
MRSCNFALLAAACTVFSAPAFAQQATSARAADIRRYDVRRETNLVGTVISFEACSKTAPYGALLILQASSGVFEVHLGDARLLSAHQFTIQSGDTLRIVGEPLSAHQATFFVARIVQKGTQALALRTPQGSLIPYVAPRAAPANAAQRGAV